MIQYKSDEQQTIPDTQVKIVGIGGAGLNMIDRVQLDGMEGAELLALNSDTRPLGSSIAQQKIQIGPNLTKGLGCGGDPELGLQAAKEVEAEIRDALRDRKMIFICVGLGGGTGSGAAPLVTRIAREMGAFVVVFATMPFGFEGRRRREQAETALNEISVIANALVTFDNTRMGELVLAAQGIHEAFAAADRMISESIKAVTRLVIRPGLINVGLDDLMTSLRATRSRCLFGSGIAYGENRSQAALKNALNSPLLDKGRLLKNTKTALVHICGGTGMTLFEVELLMRELSKNVPEEAHILFGAAVDESMGDALSVTIISSLPESELVNSQPLTEKTPSAIPAVSAVSAVVEPEVIESSDEIQQAASEAITEEDEDDFYQEPVAEEHNDAEGDDETSEEVAADDLEELSDEEGEEIVAEENQPEPEAGDDAESADSPAEDATEEKEEKRIRRLFGRDRTPAAPVKGAQPELELDGGPRGKFAGEAPNLVDGEDLDIPAFLRNRK